MQRSEAPAGPDRSLHLQFERLPRVSPGASAKALLAGAAAVGVCGIPLVSLLPIGPLSAHMVHHIGLMSVLAPLGAVALAPLVHERIERLRAGRGVMLWTADQNVGAHRLFERVGFRRTMVEMAKEL